MRIQYIKVDYFVQSSPLSSLVLPNTRLSLNPTLRVLSYNTICHIVRILDNKSSNRSVSIA